MKLKCPVCGITQDSSQGTSHTHINRDGYPVIVPLSIVINIKETYARPDDPRKN